MNGKGVGIIATASSQVGGLEDWVRLEFSLATKASGLLCTCLRPARSARKVGGSRSSRHIDIARCGMNGKGVGIIAIPLPPR
jgi:hypothetical protein